MLKIDAEYYESGREAFNAGHTIRDVTERLSELGADANVSEDKLMSYAIGFADGLLDRLRIR